MSPKPGKDKGTSSTDPGGKHSPNRLGTGAFKSSPPRDKPSPPKGPAVKSTVASSTSPSSSLVPAVHVSPPSTLPEPLAHSNTPVDPLIPSTGPRSSTRLTKPTTFPDGEKYNSPHVQFPTQPSTPASSKPFASSSSLDPSTSPFVPDVSTSARTFDFGSLTAAEFVNRGETTFESREEEIVEGFRPIQHSKTDISRKSLTARQMEEAKWKWEEGKLLKEKKDIQALLEKGKGYRFQAWTMLEGLERAFEEKMENDLELWRKRSSRPSDQVYLKERERDMEILASRLNNVIDVV